MPAFIIKVSSINMDTHDDPHRRETTSVLSLWYSSRHGIFPDFSGNFDILPLTSRQEQAYIIISTPIMPSIDCCPFAPMVLVDNVLV